MSTEHSNEYNGPDRRRKLTDEDIANIKEQLLESIYADIGKSIVKKFIWVSGAILSAFYIALSHKEKIIDFLK